MNLIPILAEIELPGAVSKGTNLVPGLLFKDTLLVGGGVLLVLVLGLGFGLGLGFELRFV